MIEIDDDVRNTNREVGFDVKNGDCGRTYRRISFDEYEHERVLIRIAVGNVAFVH
jgi:hypothetical protein